MSDLNELLDRLSSQIEAMQQEHQCKIDDLSAKLDTLLDCLAPQSKIVGTVEAGQILGISERTVRDWHKNGKMPKLASGKGEHLKWERVAVERLAQANKRGGRPRNVA